MEYARNPLGIAAADHAETGDPAGRERVITRLECSLVGELQNVRIADGSRSSLAYQGAAAAEPFRCGFGLNPEYRERLEQSPLQVVGTSDDGAVRIVELPDHPFYLATLFLPQLTSKAGSPHPLVVAFVKAASDYALLHAPRAPWHDN